MTVARIDQLGDEERARFDEWADRWIEVGLRTGSADRERFEAAAHDCYQFAGIPFPGVVVWVPSPLVLAFAAPAAAFAIELREAAGRLTPLGRGGAVGGAVRGAVDGAVDGAVRGAVRDAVGGAVLRRAVLKTINSAWYRYVGGQFWVGGWYWRSPSYTSFFREICGLELSGDLWDRGRAYEATAESACWWWPHRRFVMVCERPDAIQRELVDARRARGWGSHRLHSDDGPAAVWPDGWGIWSVHGVRVTRQIVEAPQTLTVEQIRSEPNAEVRRIMVDRFGAERYLRESDAELLDDDPAWGKLWRVVQPGDEDLVMVEVVNSTPEPDGSIKTYWLRVPPTFRAAQAAVAWTFDVPANEYELEAQT